MTRKCVANCTKFRKLKNLYNIKIKLRKLKKKKNKRLTKSKWRFSFKKKNTF